MKFFKKIIPYHAKIIAFIATIICSCLILVNEYYQFKDKVEFSLLPSISAYLDQVAYDSQTQLEFIQFNTVKSYSPYVNSDSFDLDSCLFEIQYNDKKDTFSLTNKGDYNNLSNKDGILLGQGDFNKFRDREKRRLCYITISATSNSELIRLAKNESLFNSNFYYISRFSDYTFLYDGYYTNERMLTFKPSFIRDDYQRVKDKDSRFWVSLSHKSAYNKNSVISFVKNITNEYNNTIGFLSRSFTVNGLSDTAKKTIWRTDETSNIVSLGQLSISNRDAEIYHSPETLKNEIKYGFVQMKAKDNKETESLFGNFAVTYNLPYRNIIIALFSENAYLLAIPFILFILMYMISMQVLRAIRESDKQNFDKLTMVYNRQGFEQKVKSKVKKMIAQNKTAHILVLDANKFKKINDTYGHEMGDQAIKIIADSAVKITHEGDDVVRLGGDEFLIILYIPNDIEFTDEQFLYSLNRKISYECKAKSVPLFTVTLGHMSYSAHSQLSLDAIIKQADKILLDRKWLDKIDLIDQGFDFYHMSLNEREQSLKVDMAKAFDFISAEHRLQDELNDEILNAYRHELNYLMSNYFQLIYSITDDDNEKLHRFRINIVDSHNKADVSMSVFYFLLVKFSGFLRNQLNFDEHNEKVYNRVIAYELYYISSLHMR